MTEHEKLKEICDKIGYKSEVYDFGKNIYGALTFRRNGFNEVEPQEIADVREIIFTQEFMYKFVSYAWNINRDNYSDRIYHDLMINLDNPVQYLYNLIK